MTLKYLDHVNLRTGRLAELQHFYGDVLGLRDGPRPDFTFGGAWYYLGDRPVVHLVEVADAPEAPTPRIEHFAFMAEGLQTFREGLEKAEINYSASIVPGFGWTQLFLRDPDGNKVEVTFKETGQA